MTTAQVMKQWIEGPFAPTLSAQKEAIRLVRGGISYPDFIVTIKSLGLERETALDYLHIAPRTRARLKDKPLNSKQSEGLLRLVRVFSQANHTLGNREKAWHWLEQPNRALEGETPVSLLDTELGAQMVSDVLGRIEYGVFS